jgi:tetratricopeptide (TPR) repeat protein
MSTLCLVLLLMWTPIAEMQVPVEYIIWGRVVISDGGLPNARGIEVRLENPGHTLLNSVNSDADGRFQFRNLAPGTYYLYINLPGFAPVYEEVRLAIVSTPPGGRASSSMTSPSQANVTLFLRRGPSDTVANNTFREGETKTSESPTSTGTLDASVYEKYASKAVKEYRDGMADTVKGNTDKAYTHFAKAIQLDPKFYEAMMQLGCVLLDKGRLLERNGKTDEASKVYQDSVAALDRAVAMGADSADGHYFLGSALFKTNELESAEDHLKQAISVPKPLQAARLMLVNVYMKERRYREALDQLTAYLASNTAGPERQAAEQLQSQIQRALP